MPINNLSVSTGHTIVLLYNLPRERERDCFKLIHPGPFAYLGITCTEVAASVGGSKYSTKETCGDYQIYHDTCVPGLESIHHNKTHFPLRKSETTLLGVWFWRSFLGCSRLALPWTSKQFPIAALIGLGSLSKSGTWGVIERQGSAGPPHLPLQNHPMEVRLNSPCSHF